MNIKKLFSLENKCALVIGGAGKIGYSMAEALGEAGARVYIGSTQKNNYENAMKKLNTAGINSKGIRVDQSNEKEVINCLNYIENDYKTPDVLINCGVERPMKQFFDDEIIKWDRSMEVNARGLFIVCRTFAKAMAKAGGGSIINVSSIYGIVAPDSKLYEGTDMQTEPDYPYNKGGMIMFSKYLAAKFAKQNVRVNVVAPGGFYNNQEETFYSQYCNKVPMGRMAKHEDMKGVAVFLASEAAQYITGATIPVDGGFSII
jgi:NAD(P)-dependent dehydrogenase (short-subunit alcohol dehydrogenase family)